MGEDPRDEGGRDDLVRGENAIGRNTNVALAECLRGVEHDRDIIAVVVAPPPNDVSFVIRKKHAEVSERAAALSKPEAAGVEAIQEDAREERSLVV